MVVLGGAWDEPEAPRVPTVGVAGAVAGEGFALLSGLRLTLQRNQRDDQNLAKS